MLRHKGHLLGVLYTNGDGISRDYGQAAQWFRRAADQEEPKAQYNLGLMYAGGVGVPQDPGEAYVWFTLAAARMPLGAERDQAVHNRDVVAARLTSAQVADTQVRASTWQPPGESPTPSPARRPSTDRTVHAQAPSRVRRAQERLQAAGFDPGPPDGTLGPKTRDACGGTNTRRAYRPQVSLMRPPSMSWRCDEAMARERSVTRCVRGPLLMEYL